jgi:hypothetical protein
VASSGLLLTPAPCSQNYQLKGRGGRHQTKTLTFSKLQIDAGMKWTRHNLTRLIKGVDGL